MPGMTLRRKTAACYILLALTTLAVSALVLIRLQPTLNAATAAQAAGRLELRMTPQDVAAILGDYSCKADESADWREEDWKVTWTHIVKVIYTKDRSGVYRARAVRSG